MERKKSIMDAPFDAEKYEQLEAMLCSVRPWLPLVLIRLVLYQYLDPRIGCYDCQCKLDEEYDCFQCAHCFELFCDDCGWVNGTILMSKCTEENCFECKYALSSCPRNSSFLGHICESCKNEIETSSEEDYSSDDNDVNLIN